MIQMSAWCCAEEEKKGVRKEGVASEDGAGAACVGATGWRRGGLVAQLLAMPMNIAHEHSTRERALRSRQANHTAQG